MVCLLLKNKFTIILAATLNPQSRWLAQAKSDFGKDKVTICYNEIQNSKVTTHKTSKWLWIKWIFNYASWAMSLSPAFDNFIQLSHFDCLIDFLATYLVVTSTLFSSRTLSTISRFLVAKMSSVTVTHSKFSNVRSSSQKLMFYRIKE